MVNYILLTYGYNQQRSRRIDQEICNNKEQLSDDKSEGKLLGDEEQEKFRYDWMYLAKMNPNIHINFTSNLGGRATGI
jgi:hypothetical protein